MPNQSEQALRKALRNKFRERRRNISAHERERASKLIADSLEKVTTAAARQSGVELLHIAAYLAADGEVSLTDWLVGTSHHIYLPRISSSNPSADAGAGGREMAFHAWQPGEPLAENRFGIGEPLVSSPTITSAVLDLVLAPLVAFDSRGARLGMGGGYYDRCFAGTEVTLIGVAFQCQQSPTRIPSASWDVPLSAVVTEHGVLECNGPSLLP